MGVQPLSEEFYECPELKIPQYDATTGGFTLNGAALSPRRVMSYAQLMAIVALGSSEVDKYDQIIIALNDVTTDGYGSPALVIGNSTTHKFHQIGNPWYYANYSSIPDPTYWKGAEFIAGDAAVGGGRVRSNGTILRYTDKSPQLLAVVSGYTHPPLQTDRIIGIQAALLVNNGKNIFQPGDECMLRLNVGKNGATDYHRMNFLFGPNGSITTAGVTSDVAIENAGERTFSNGNLGDDELFNFRCISNTSIIKCTPGGASGFIGSNNTTRSTAVTVSNINAAVQYVSFVFSLNGVTNITEIERASIYLQHGS